MVGVLRDDAAADDDVGGGGGDLVALGAGVATRLMFGGGGRLADVRGGDSTAGLKPATHS